MEIIIRSWTTKDDENVRDLLREAALSHIWPSFCLVLRRHWFYYMTMAAATVAFMFTWDQWMSVYVITTALAVNFLSQVAIACFYVYGPPLQDMQDVPTNYFATQDSHFWVAEIISDGPPGCKPCSVIAGTIAIVKKSGINGPDKTAWLRRMAVLKKYQGLGIGKRLVETVITFCKEQKYDKIELITTEIHAKARKLYHRMGFSAVGFKPYAYLRGLVNIWTYEYEYDLHDHEIDHTNEC